MKRLTIGTLLPVLVLVAACGADIQSASPLTEGAATAAPATAMTAPASAMPSQAAAGGPRPIVIDTDLAADDILAIRSSCGTRPWTSGR